MKSAHSKVDEIKVYGFNAAMALWQNRAADVIRVYVAEGRLKEAGPLLKWCATHKKAYHVLTPEELERVSSSVHHEGLVILAKAATRLTDVDLPARLSALPKAVCLLFLDGVGNPHNVGAILRLGAHFDVPMILGRSGELPALTPAATRIAEGGAEHVTMVQVSKTPETLKLLRSHGFKIVATSSHAKRSLYSEPLPERAVIVLGAETIGASPAMLAAADHQILIPGTGKVESLNVATATALVLGEHWRVHRSRAP